MPVSPLLTSEDQRRQQEDQQQAQQASMATLYGGSGTPGYGGMYPGMFDQGAAPAYGAASGGGVMPRRDDAFTQFVSHMHGVGALRTNRYTKGPYNGMEPDEAQEAMHDDWLKMSPEARGEYAKREFGADTVDANNPSGFFSKEQQNQLAPGFDENFAALQARVGLAGSSSSIVPFNPGSINDGNEYSARGRSGGAHLSIGQADGTRMDYGAQPSYHGPDAIPMGQRYTRTGGLASLTPVQQVQQPLVVPRQMGNPNDTGRFGPIMSGGGNQPTYSPPGVPAVSTTLRPADASTNASFTSPPIQPALIPHPDFPAPTMGAPNRMTDSFIGPPSPFRAGMSPDYSRQEAQPFVRSTPAEDNMSIGARNISQQANMGSTRAPSALAFARPVAVQMPNFPPDRPPSYMPVPAPARAVASLR